MINIQIIDKNTQSQYGNDYHRYLMDYYPDIHQLWCDAVNADFDSVFLYETGKIKESDKKYKEHEDLWDQYCLASKLVLADFFGG